MAGYPANLDAHPPCRDRRDVALSLAREALRQIRDEQTTMGPEATAEAVLARIEALVPGEKL